MSKDFFVKFELFKSFVFLYWSGIENKCFVKISKKIIPHKT